MLVARHNMEQPAAERQWTEHEKACTYLTYTSSPEAEAHNSIHWPPNHADRPHRYTYLPKY